MRSLVLATLGITTGEMLVMAVVLGHAGFTLAGLVTFAGALAVERHWPPSPP